MKRKDDFIMQDVAGENLLVPIGAQVMDLNGLITPNDTGAFLWDQLAQERTAEELDSALAERFEVDVAAARAGVRTFLDEIGAMGLLEG